MHRPRVHSINKSMVKSYARKEIAAPPGQFIALHGFNAPKQTISEYQLSRNEREQSVAFYTWVLFKEYKREITVVSMVIG